MNEENTPQLDHLELIDATQNAVMEAVDNVSELIAETSEETTPQAHHEVFYKEAEFWVGFAFILVVVLLERPVARFAKTALTKRRDDIADQLAQAEKLQDDAQHLWADYERKFVNAEQEAADILKNSQKQIERNFEEETRKFDNEYLRKSNDAQRIMKSAQDHLLDDINEQASQKAVQTAVRYLKRTLDDKRQTALIDESIDHILQELQH